MFSYHCCFDDAVGLCTVQYVPVQRDVNHIIIFDEGFIPDLLKLVFEFGHWHCNAAQRTVVLPPCHRGDKVSATRVNVQFRLCSTVSLLRQWHIARHHRCHYPWTCLRECSSLPLWTSRSLFHLSASEHWCQFPCLW